MGSSRLATVAFDPHVTVVPGTTQLVDPLGQRKLTGSRPAAAGMVSDLDVTDQIARRRRAGQHGVLIHRCVEQVVEHGDVACALAACGADEGLRLREGCQGRAGNPDRGSSTIVASASAASGATRSRFVSAVSNSCEPSTQVPVMFPAMGL